MDIGHRNLLKDLKELLKEAEELEFHDFQNRKYETPKMKFVDKLSGMINNTKEGKYDN